MFARAIGIGVVVIGLVTLLVWSQWRNEPLKVSGFVEADEIRVGSRVGGRVQRVHVKEGQQVKAGDVLLELEPYDLTARRAEAQARLAQARSLLEELKAGARPQEIAAAAARLEAARSQLDLAKLNLDKVRTSFQSNAASQDEMDEAAEEVRAAEADVDLRQQELNLQKEGTRPEDIVQADAAAKASEAALAVIERQIDELIIKDAAEGRIEAVDLQPGDLVAPAGPILSMIDTSNLWVRAFVPENRLNLTPDQKVRVGVDSFPGRTFTARITFVARQGEFTPSNIQTPEERSKQVFRVKATLDEGLDILRPGMAADVWPDAR